MKSIIMNTPCEFIDVTPLNPLISKCLIKVCYVGDEPNRNHSIITKQVAKSIANSLPGSPIVGYYNEQKEDFEEHNEALIIKDGKITFSSNTKPYGFVDLNAKVWFQKYLDDGVEHEYMVTEGYLWTGQFPECQRIIDEGNNQSMELDKKTINAFWTKPNERNERFYIINEALISKLCILGKDEEPCFEGASITDYSLGEDFKQQLFSLMDEMKKILNKEGGKPMEQNLPVEPVIEEPAVAAEPVAEEPVEEPAVVEEPAAAAEEPVVAEEPAADPEPAEAEPAPVQYNLEEIPEYVEISQKYNDLQAQFALVQQECDNLKASHADLLAEIEALRSFKCGEEKKQKQYMIDKFSMLSDEDKKDVLDNIDTYSLDEIEAKLSVLCVRNSVNFGQRDDSITKEVTTVNFSAAVDTTPDWIKAIQNSNKK